jgi:hypothetical protein
MLFCIYLQKTEGDVSLKEVLACGDDTYIIIIKERIPISNEKSASKISPII